MATKRMLIDASHPEETRVVVLDGTRLEDYDVEVASRRQLKGNIYLAKVIRVEPSLQAAFVEYGGNRHGFLAFNEIHPDYYQIPVADRQVLLAEQEERERAERAQLADEHGESAETGEEAENGEEAAEPVDTVGGDDDEEIERRPARTLSRNYKIQEVIKRRQILLVQVVKEERGNKGAALTTYLSLAGRYCVLMPNTSRGGGISRKIGILTDRKRLKKILMELEVPSGMGVIVRTAGSGRTKAEIKRDYEYLMRLWSNIRETTLSSIAPAPVYEEASLIKRSIRDLYGRDTEEILIQGEAEYRIAKEFMKLFIPSHAKRVKLHDDSERPLFTVYQVENQLDAMHLPSVQLKSGGYIVINPTEALVSIDVNSGRATRERHIEETALRTNIEAADEVARQLRLRDLAGLIVIDFIDMENSRNQGQVERRLKEAMKNERARIQLGRISPFGLLELSRQRLRPSLLETSFETCPYCSGMGVCRTTESTVLSILRKIEEEGMKSKGGSLTVTAAPAVAMYLLNQKRTTLAKMEIRFGLALIIAADGTFAPAEHRLDRLKGPAVEAAGEGVAAERTARVDAVAETAAETEAEVETGAESGEEPAEAASGGEGEGSAKRGRRRRPRRRRHTDDETRTQVALDDRDGGDAADENVDAGEPSNDDAGEEVAVGDETLESDGDGGELNADQAAEDASRKRRRRGKRGGRRRPRRPDEDSPDATGDIGGEATAEQAGGDGGNGDAVPEYRVDHAGDPADADGPQPAAPDEAGEQTLDEEADGVASASDGTDHGDTGGIPSHGGPRRPSDGASDDASGIAMSEPSAFASGSGDITGGDAGDGSEVADAVETAELEPSLAGSGTVAEAGTEAFEIVRYEVVDAREREAWRLPDGHLADGHLADGERHQPAAEDAAPERPSEASAVEAERRDEAVASGGNGEAGHETSAGYGQDKAGDIADAACTEDESLEAEAREREAAAAAARTNIIQVGADTDLHGSPRKGWWQRFMS